MSGSLIILVLTAVRCRPNPFQPVRRSLPKKPGINSTVAGQESRRLRVNRETAQGLLDKALYISSLRLMRRSVELEKIGAAFAHLTGALEERSLFDAKRGGRQVRVDASSSQQFDPTRGGDAALQGSVDRDPLDLDLGRDLGAVSHDQLAA